MRDRSGNSRDVTAAITPAPCPSLLRLPSHEEFEAEIRARHGRKPAFWAYVNGTRRDRHDDEYDLTP